MLKYIAAFDGLKYSLATRDYAIHLSRQAYAHLVGVFLDDTTYTSYKIYEMISEKGVTEERIQELEKLDAEKRKQAANDFETVCNAEGMVCDVHHDEQVALQELIHESLFADLLIIDRKETLTHYEEAIPTRFTRDLLTEAHCPVLLVPSVYQPAEQILLLYDGTPDSIYALRMFSYVCSAIKYLPTTLVHVAEQGNKSPADAILLKEFLKRHFPAATLHLLRGNAEMAILQFLTAQTATSLVVLGAYGRGNISRWMRPSMADRLLEQFELPLFIAHRKV